MLLAKFQDHRTSGSGEDLKVLTIYAWLPSWSCDQDHFYKIYVPTSQEGSTLNLALFRMVKYMYIAQRQG